jgi:light-regulated signal transduction histidine kinase (bacteriophytochrome)
MRALIEDLLAYSRVDTQGKPLTPTESDPVLQQTLRALRLQAAETGATVTADPLPPVRADRT